MNTSANTIQTVYKLISHLGVSTSVSTALANESKTKKRAVKRRRFAGAIIYNDINSSQPLTPTISIAGQTVTYKLYRTTILKGDSAVGTDEDFGIELESDQYVSVAVAESLGSGDNLYIFLRFRDIN